MWCFFIYFIVFDLLQGTIFNEYELYNWQIIEYCISTSEGTRTATKNIMTLRTGKFSQQIGFLLRQYFLTISENAQIVRAKKPRLQQKWELNDANF